MAFHIVEYLTINWIPRPLQPLEVLSLMKIFLSLIMVIIRSFQFTTTIINAKKLTKPWIHLKWDESRANL